MESIIKYATYPENEDYHASDNISWSKKKYFLKSPMEFKHHFIDGSGISATPAMSLGSLIHGLVLEPLTVGKLFKVSQDMPLRSKDEKAVFINHLIALGCANIFEWESISKMNASELRALQSSGPITFVSQPEWNKACKIADVVSDTYDLTLNKVESAFTAEICGVICQCKCDYIETATNQIRDIKTTGMIHKWVDNFDRRELLFADTFYRMVIEAATGILPPPIYYDAVSTVEPYDVVTRYYPERLYQSAKIVLMGHLKRIKECRDSGIWAGIDGDNPTPKEARINSWAETELEDMAKAETEFYDQMLEDRVDLDPFGDVPVNLNEKGE